MFKTMMALPHYIQQHNLNQKAVSLST